MKFNRSLSVVLASVSVLACSAGAASAAQPTGSLGGPLNLDDEGMLFVNGQLVLSAYPTGAGTTQPTPATFAVDQMFVHYRFPHGGDCCPKGQVAPPAQGSVPVQEAPGGKPRKLPIIMVHGAGLTGMSWETTPDGREGWGTYFTRRGFKTYVVDFPGRGRAGIDPTPLNSAKFNNNAAAQPSLSRTGVEAAWTTFRFGPTYLTPFPGVQAPEVNLNGTVNNDAVNQFSSQGVPNGEATLTPAAATTIPAAIIELLKKTGPAILMVHSQAGSFADTVVSLRPDLVKMMIHVESNCGTAALTATQLNAYRQIPTVLYVHGDNVIGNPASTGQPRLTNCTAYNSQINANGGHSSLVQLPDVGIKGNDHMLMQDRNNLTVADFIISRIVAAGN